MMKAIPYGRIFLQLALLFNRSVAVHSSPRTKGWDEGIGTACPTHHIGASPRNLRKSVVSGVGLQFRQGAPPGAAFEDRLAKGDRSLLGKACFLPMGTISPKETTDWLPPDPIQGSSACSAVP
ncbi:hypothetical protein [Labrys miyagiensis]|uniref:hypothetical protein n=1 Tax=Labrys miyagiensis TaxID=346912 RepID=UPI0024E0A034|nr:hypothetical protein [Labrys miyagiensis]